MKVWDLLYPCRGQNHPTILPSVRRADSVIGARFRTTRCDVRTSSRHTRASGCARLIKDRGCKLLYLPPYSPDFSPIEEAFSKVKGLLRRVEGRSREALVEAVGWALSALTAHDARGFFAHHATVRRANCCDKRFRLHAERFDRRPTRPCGPGVLRTLYWQPSGRSVSNSLRRFQQGAVAQEHVTFGENRCRCEECKDARE